MAKINSLRDHHGKSAAVVFLFLLLLPLGDLSAQIFRAGSSYLEIDAGRKTYWYLDLATLADSLIQQKLSVPSDSVDILFTNGDRVLNPALIAPDGATDGEVLTYNTIGGITWAAPPGGGYDPDTLDGAFTGPGRLLNPAIVAPGGMSGMILQTNAGVTGWVADPNLHAGRSQYFYSTSITINNSADTTGDKHVLYLSAITREYPIVHAATGYAAFAAHVYIRDALNYQSYSATLTYNPGYSAASFFAGDKILLRFFPGGGTGIAKLLRIYRIPAGFHYIGAGASNKVYGDHVGYWSIPGTHFPATGSVNIDVTLSYKAK